MYLLGNYGNKLDENIPSQISTTSPANPIFDGTAYYYLPWLEYKPCIVVESQWEDVSYRIETQNIFLGIADELVSTCTYTCTCNCNCRFLCLVKIKIVIFVDNENLTFVSNNYSISFAFYVNKC